MDLEVSKVIRKANPTKAMCNEVAALVKTKDRCGLPPEIVELSTKHVMASTAFELGPRSEPVATYSTLAFASFVRLGVPPKKVNDALSRVANDLDCGEVFHASRVMKLLATLLPERHPCSGKGKIRVVPMSIPADDHETIRDNFLRGGHSWQAVSLDVDIARDNYNSLKKAINDGSGSRLVVLEGVGGSGKTTLARRIALDLYREGNFLALEINDEFFDDDDWNAVEELASVMDGRRLLIVVDDIFRMPSIFDALNRLDDSKTISVLGTTRPGERETAFSHLEIPEKKIELGAISVKEVDRLCAKLDVEKTNISQAEMKRLMETGQIFLLATTLLKGSLDEFARGLIVPLRENAADLLDGYIDLCVAGRQDLSTPKAVLIRNNSLNLHLDKTPFLKGLVERSKEEGDRLRPGHALLAEAVLRVENVNPFDRSFDLIDCCDLNRPEERRYALKLLQICLEFDKPGLIAYVERVKTVVKKLKETADYIDLKRMVWILEGIDEVATAAELKQHITPSKVRSGPDAASCMYDSEQEGKFADAFPTLLKFYSDDDTGYARWKFIEKSSHLVGAEQKAALLNLMHLWLQQRQFPPSETAATLNLLIRTPTDEASKFEELIEDILRSKNASVDLVLRAILPLRSKIKSNRAAKPLFEYAEPVIGDGTEKEKLRILAGLGRIAENAEMIEEQERFLGILLKNAQNSDNGSKVQAQYIKECYSLVTDSRRDELKQIIESVIASAGSSPELTGILRSLESNS